MNKRTTRARKPGRAPAARPLLWPLLHAAHAAEARLEAALAEVGLSGAKHGALTKLAEAGGPLSLGELAERLTCVRSNITQLVDRLEADGLVRREEDPHDRRAVRAVLTALGRERQKVGAARAAAVEAELEARLAGLDGAALERLVADLE